MSRNISLIRGKYIVRYSEPNSFPNIIMLVFGLNIMMKPFLSESSKL